MDVIILCAGFGSRLMPLTEHKPKCMVEINGIPLIDRLVNQIRASKENANINIVAGYKKEILLKHFHNSEINIVENEFYASSNNMYSCYLALNKFDEFKDTLIINGDCIYEDQLIHKACNLDTSTIIADRSFFNEESMKVKTFNDYVIEMSKNLTKEDYTFTSIDMYFFKESEVNTLFETIKTIIDQKDINSWTEVAIDTICRKNPTLIKVDLFDNLNWYEIDDKHDLRAAEKIFG